MGKSLIEPNLICNLKCADIYHNNKTDCKNLHDESKLMISDLSIKHG